MIRQFGQPGRLRKISDHLCNPVENVTGAPAIRGDVYYKRVSPVAVIPLHNCHFAMNGCDSQDLSDNPDDRTDAHFAHLQGLADDIMSAWRSYEVRNSQLLKPSGTRSQLSAVTS